jgi:hypothetical protein
VVSGQWRLEPIEELWCRIESSSIGHLTASAELKKEWQAIWNDVTLVQVNRYVERVDKKVAKCRSGGKMTSSQKRQKICLRRRQIF